VDGANPLSFAERCPQRHVPGRVSGKALRTLPVVVIHALGDGNDQVQARDDVEVSATPAERLDRAEVMPVNRRRAEPPVTVCPIQWIKTSVQRC
jgi:hypothetical protein